MDSATSRIQLKSRKSVQLCLLTGLPLCAGVTLAGWSIGGRQQQVSTQSIVFVVVSRSYARALLAQRSNRQSNQSSSTRNRKRHRRRPTDRPTETTTKNKNKIFRATKPLRISSCYRCEFAQLPGLTCLRRVELEFWAGVLRL